MTVNLKTYSDPLSRLRGQTIAWLIRQHPAVYLRRKRLGTHTGEHRLKEHGDFLSMHARLVETGESISGVRERYNLWMLARAAQRLPGALAEVGVYRGGTAMLLAEAKGDASLHLFDTFDGMPDTDNKHDGVFSSGMFKDTSLESVKQRLSPWKKVELHPGLFPDSAKDIDPNLQFKLTNIDVDIRSSTLSCLQYFYPRTVRGGFLVLHDYNDCGVPGVKAATDEFMRDKPELVIELWDTQALIVKQ
jgi:O-methyltransferase